MSETTNIQLERLAKQHSIPLIAVCFKDELYRMKPMIGGYVVNLADSNQNGTHWVSIWIGKHSCAYFDSFGVLPPLEIIEFLSCKFCNCVYSTADVQNINSGWCGIYCLEFLKFMSRGYGYQRFLSEFSDEPTENLTVLNSLKL